MHFKLPENLQIELLAYDPKLKQLARTASSKTKSTKPKFPLGQPYGFVPEDAIKTSLMQNAIDLMNAEPIERRHHEFKRITGFGPDAKSSTVGILYHYESVWYAAWLPPKGKEQDYVYGFAFAYKDNKTSRGMIPYALNNIQDTQVVPYGKSNFITYSRVVTKQDIINGYDRPMYEIPQLSWRKGNEMREVIKRFRDSLADTIPTWNDSRYGIFARIKNSNYVKLLEVERYIHEEDWNNWKPSVDNVFAIIDGLKSGPHDYNWGYYKPIRHIIDKPFFRKWIQARCDEVVLRLSNEDNQSEMIVKHPWNQISELFKAIGYVHHVWPDCPIDYYQTHIDNLLALYNLRWQFEGNRVGNWLNKHMPVASFFHMVDKHIKDLTAINVKTSMLVTISNNTGLTQYYFTEWRDTLQLLHKVLCDRETKNETLAPPKRWRLNEFHDYVQGEAWKVEHTNHKLPQDLFPTPIKVQIEHTEKVNATSTADKMRYNIQDNLNYSRPILDFIDGHFESTPVNYTFFQPIDTHQLAEWGQAVRNCVGDASSYADGVRKKKHFIVLAMLDNKPKFTIQLEVDMGMMSVKQIVGMSNARLDLKENQRYAEAFRLALKARESELQSA
jgi:hypothetical protein